MVINLFAGPNTGKTGTAGGLLNTFKAQHLTCGLVCEFAQERIWAGERKAIECQPYITGVQMYRQHILLGEVDYIITDSPILLGIHYGEFGKTESWEQCVTEWFKLFTNINIFLVRYSDTAEFDDSGRIHNLEQSLELDCCIRSTLDKYNIPYSVVQVKEDNSHVDEIQAIVEHEMQYLFTEKNSL